MSEPQELEFEVKVRNPENTSTEMARGYVAIDGKKIQDFELESGKELNIPFKASLEEADTKAEPAAGTFWQACLSCGAYF